MINRIIAIIMVLTALCSCGKGTEKEVVDNAEAVETIQEPISEQETEPEPSLPPLNYVRSLKVRNIGPLAEVFNDSNYVQLASAIELGIDPIEDFSLAYFTKRPIVKITSNRFYQVDSLTHSLPYLVPEAATLLTDIGRRFTDSLEARGGDSYRIKVTSLLRTPLTVRKLRRVNVNAKDTSAHQYGTTFDLSWTNFYCLDENRQINEGDLKNLLAEVLDQLRSEGRCYVKFEKKTSCFHVTARK